MDRVLGATRFSYEFSSMLPERLRAARSPASSPFSSLVSSPSISCRRTCSLNRLLHPASCYRRSCAKLLPLVAVIAVSSTPTARPLQLDVPFPCCAPLPLSPSPSFLHAAGVSCTELHPPIAFTVARSSTPRSSPLALAAPVRLLKSSLFV